MADAEPPPTGGTQSSSTMSGDGGVRVWEKPWTFEDMRKESNNWSLAGDAGLLLYLKDFSQKMISRVHEIEKEVDGLMHESKMTGVRVNNVFNDFIMLANTQFVENRVYDEDVSETDSKKTEGENNDKEMTREQREAELIPKVKEALELGINVIDQAFEQLDSHVADSDSEDDETGYRADPLLEAKDPYLIRPLPLMIGTPRFMEDEAVGLGEDESEEEESDHGSISESESEDEEKEPETKSEDSEYSDSESGDSDVQPTKQRPKDDSQSEEDSESDGDLFGTKDEDDSDVDNSEEEPTAPPVQKPAGPMDFASELAKKLGAPAPVPDKDDDVGEEKQDKEPKQKGKKKRDKKDSTNSNKQKGEKSHSSKKKKNEEEEPFPADEDDDSPFGTKGGLFSGGSKGLFDDSDEENDLFADIEKKNNKESEEEEEEERKTERKRTISNSKKSKPKGGVSIFGDGGDDMFTESTVKEQPPKTKPAGGGGGLFDDDEEEDDLFGTVTKKKNVDEDEITPENVDEEEKIPKKKDINKKKLPPGAVSMFGGAPNPLAAAIKKQRKPDSDEGENDWSDEEKPRAASIKSNQSTTSINSGPKPIPTKVNKPSPSPSSNSLFDDDADDALFNAPVKPRTDSKSKAKPTKSLFDEEDDGDLFGIKPNNKPSQQVKKEEKAASDSLFDDEEGDLFGNPSKPKESPKKKPVGGVALFGGEDILKKNENKTQVKEPEKLPEPTKAKEEVVKKKEPVAKTTLSLFDDDEEEEGDLFEGGFSTTKSSSATKTKTSAGLFDDGGMFAEEESPDVDIFNKPKSPVLENKETKTSKPVSTPKQDRNLFDNEDLFDTSKPSMSTVDLDGVTTTESSDNIPQVSTTEEEPKSKKPVGGVSMFGGVDPFAAMNKSKKEPSLPKEKSNETGPTASPDFIEKQKTRTQDESKPNVIKQKDPLFGDDDEDDMFRAPPSQVVTANRGTTHPFPKPKTTPKPSIPSKPKDVPKSTAPSNNLFGSPESDDDLFSQKPAPAKQESKPVVTSPKKPAGAVSMFGGVDLFGGNKKKEPSIDLPSPDEASDEVGKFSHGSSPVSSSKALGKTGKEKEIPTSAAPPDNLFGSPESDNDLFSQKPEPAKQESKPVVTSPKKPAGAVSMFGGVDMFGGNKKKEPSLDLPSRDDASDDLRKSSPVSTLPVTSSKTPGKIGKLQMNLGINPAALLPGAAPPNKEPEVVPVGFDAPAKANTLHSANKDRAKIQSKRRPPSRRGRPSSSADSLPGSETNPAIPSLASLEESPPLENKMEEPPPLENRVPKPTSDLFGNDDLLGEMSDTSLPSASLLPNKDMFKDDLFSSDRKKASVMSDDDLFNSVKSNKQKTTQNNIDDGDEDLFGKPTSVATKNKDSATENKHSLMNGDADIFTEKSNLKGKLNESDDIFHSKPKVKSTKQNSATKVLVDDEDDNIFSTKTKPKKQSDFENILDDKPKQLQNDTNGQPSISVEDDIFADASVNRKSDSKFQKVKENDDAFADSAVKNDDTKKVVNEDEDLFNKPTKSEKNKKASRAKAKTKDEDLFKDETDIFADIPAAKPREKKKKKAAEKKSVFKDDADDIFAKPTSNKPKAKKEKKTEVTKKQATDSADIFDDPLS